MIAILLLFVHSHFAFGQDDSNNPNPRPSMDVGAVVFLEYCALCHGTKGMGDGVLAQRMQAYPSTDLTSARKTSSTENIIEAIVFGGVLKNLSEHMPPFGNELSWTKTQSVALFIKELRSNQDVALKRLANVKESDTASLRSGKKIFTHRCTLCHGEYGEGDGRMAKVIKTPPPADLTASRLNKDYLEKIILLGGEGVGRSLQMPPWKDELSTAELESVILYIESIRD